MDAWAASYGSAVGFVCVSCAGPQLAGQFGNELRLKNCHNTWVDEDDMPTWGQLGCNGLIVIDGADAVVCQASPAFLEVKGAAFRHVETLLEALLRSKPAPTLKSGRVDPSVGGHCAEVRFGADAAEDLEEEEVIVSGLSSRPELNGKRGRVLSEASNGRLQVQLEGEAAPLAIKRQNLTKAAAELPAGQAAPATGVPMGPVASVKVDVLDAEHRACESKLTLLANLTQPPGVDGKRGQISTALLGLLEAYTSHFRHEEALLDEHLYAAVAHDEAAGFSADKGARTSHFADHQAMLASVRTLLDAVPSVDAAAVQRLQRDFERHATQYDGGYADRLSAAMDAPCLPVAVP